MEVFRQPVMDTYGSNELGGQVATEHLLDQSSHNLYVQSDFYAMEFVDGNGNALHNETDGSTVVTSFLNHVAPLIRYNQGDKSHHIFKDNLGLPFQCIAPIQGRVNVNLIGKDGKDVYISYGAFDDYPDCIKAFQYRQHTPGKVRLVVVENKSYPNYKAEIDEIFNRIKTTYQDRFELRLETVDAIEPVGGKLNSIIHD